MTDRRRGIRRAAAAALAVGIGAAAAVSLPSEARRASKEASRGPTAARAARADLACRFESGDRVAWDLAVEASSAASPGGGARSTARLEVSATERDGTTSVLAARLLAGDSPPAWGEVPEDPFEVRLASDCTFEAFAFPAAFDAEARTTVRGLLLGLEIALPTGGGAKSSWIREETDGTGVYRAIYHRPGHRPGPRPGDAAGREVTKRWDGYLRRWEDREEGVLRASSEARAEAVLDAEGRWLEALDGRFHHRYELAPPGTAARDTLVVTIEGTSRLRRRPEPPPAFDLPEGDLVRLDAREPPERSIARSRPSARPKGPSPAETAPLSEADLLARIGERLARDGAGTVATASDLVAAWLLAHPGGARELVSGMRSGRIPEALRPVLFLGIAKAGTLESRDVLVEAGGDPALALPDRLRAVSALADLPEPDAETVSALAAWAGTPDAERGEIEDAATYALGVLADPERTGDASIAAASRGAIEGLLLEPVGPTSLKAALVAAGNAADPSLLPAVEPWLEAPSWPVRRAALTALRRLDPAETADLFAPLLEAAMSPGERAAIADVFAEQVTAGGHAIDEGLLSRAIARLGEEPAPGARRSLVALIGAAARDRADARDALVGHFRTETDPEVLALIGRFVSAEDLL